MADMAASVLARLKNKAANKFDFDGKVLTEALKKTFANREHSFTVEQFEQVIGFADDDAMKKKWKAFVRTTTHFAQYLKVKNKSTCLNLITKRNINIIDECKTLLQQYRQAGLCENATKVHTPCFNLDFADCLDAIELDGSVLVYADPPYFKEHYSRYYHVLNTLCLYDYPAMAVNPQTHELSIGRYRENRTVSDFGKKAKALGAFEKLIAKCSQAGAWLMISYSDNSIVDIASLQELAEEKYDVLIKKVELSHSNQGRSSTSKVDEYIFV